MYIYFQLVIFRPLQKRDCAKKRDLRVFPVFSRLCRKIEFFWKNHVFCIKTVF